MGSSVLLCPSLVKEVFILPPPGGELGLARRTANRRHPASLLAARPSICKKSDRPAEKWHRPAESGIDLQKVAPNLMTEVFILHIFVRLQPRAGSVRSAHPPPPPHTPGDGVGGELGLPRRPVRLLLDLQKVESSLCSLVQQVSIRVESSGSPASYLPVRAWLACCRFVTVLGGERGRGLVSCAWCSCSWCSCSTCSTSSCPLEKEGTGGHSRG